MINTYIYIYIRTRNDALAIGNASRSPEIRLQTCTTDLYCGIIARKYITELAYINAVQNDITDIHMSELDYGITS